MISTVVTGIGCGLPRWAIVRWVFNFIEKNRDAGVDEVAMEVRDVREFIAVIGPPRR